MTDQTPSRPPSDSRSDPRAQQAMPWLAPGAQTPPPDGGAATQQATPTGPRSANDPSDPDAQGLPPGVELPDATQYALRQTKAQMVNFIAITVFLVGWSVFVIPHQPKVGLITSGIGVVLTLFTVLRFLRARKAADAARSPEKAP